MNCSLAQTLGVIGERWTLLIVRDAFFGIRRFDQFQRDLGIARNILAIRLSRLVDEGILERRPTDDSRHEYVLTDKGLDLHPVLLAMIHWGDRYEPNPQGDRVVCVERATGTPIAPMAVRSHDGRPRGPGDRKAVPGPGLQRSPERGSSTTTKSGGD